MATSYETRVKILAELFQDYFADGEFESFLLDENLAPQLAYAIYQGIVLPTPKVAQLIDSCFEHFLLEHGLPLNGAWSSFDELFEDIPELEG